MLLINVNVEERPHLFRVLIFLPCISHDKLLKVLLQLIYFLLRKGMGNSFLLIVTGLNWQRKKVRISIFY